MAKVTVRELEFGESFQLIIQHNSLCHVSQHPPLSTTVSHHCRQLWGSLRLDLRDPSILGF